MQQSISSADVPHCDAGGWLFTQEPTWMFYQLLVKVLCWEKYHQWIKVQAEMLDLISEMFLRLLGRVKSQVLKRKKVFLAPTLMNRYRLDMTITLNTASFIHVMYSFCHKLHLLSHGGQMTQHLAPLTHNMVLFVPVTSTQSGSR